jgi:hypothetical protein
LASVATAIEFATMDREPEETSPSEFDAPDPAASDAQASPEATLLTCPICGSALDQRKCKLFCPRAGCGYFLSCADFY